MAVLWRKLGVSRTGSLYVSERTRRPSVPVTDLPWLVDNWPVPVRSDFVAGLWAGYSRSASSVTSSGGDFLHVDALSLDPPIPLFPVDRDIPRRLRIRKGQRCDGELQLQSRK